MYQSLLSSQERFTVIALTIAKDWNATQHESKTYELAPNASLRLYSKGKGKGKFQPATSHEDIEGVGVEVQRYSFFNLGTI